MKDPRDKITNQLFVATGRGTRPQGAKPPGGKALQRLALFNNERGFLGLDNGMAEAQPLKSAKGNAKQVEHTAQIAQTYIDTAVRLQAGLEQDPNRLGPPTEVGPQWRFLGPTMMENGQTYGESRVVVSGRVAAIAVDRKSVV